jgi:DNA-directed RNA polymerase beta subunit/intein/homing endonuclease
MSSKHDIPINMLIDLYFNQPRVMYRHLFDTYDQFVSEIIPYSLIQEPNYFYENVDKHMIYLHGFKCSNIRIKPPTFENDNEIKFPSDCRKNHLNYFSAIVADVQQIVERLNSITGERVLINVGDMEKETPVANIPIMVKSKFCATNIKQDLKGECKYDPGGYFIVGGAEKVVMSMEKMVDNKVLVFSKKDPSYDNGIVYTAQINSRKNDWSDNLQILTVKNRKDGVFTVSTSSQLVDIPLFILMRAMGVESDQEIISRITYDLEDIKMLNLVRPSVADSMDEEGNIIRTKEEATAYLITKLRRNKRISQSDEKLAKIQKEMYLEKILRQDLLPHLGEDIPKKIAFIGMMTNRLVNVMLGRKDVDDRDALQNKRVEPPGILLGQLFRQNWKKMLNEISKLFKKKNQSDETPINVIGQIKPSTIEQGLKTALATGIWGMNKTKKGVAQSLQRLSWVQAISSLRRILAPSMDETTAKVTSIRYVNNNQMNLLCLTGDTEVLLSNRMDMKQIKDIRDGDCVTTVNLTNMNEEPSHIYNKFGRMSERLLEIKTISGRTIKATPEHPFLVNVNGQLVWKNAGDLTTDDKVVIRHTEKMIIPEKDTEVIIKEEDILPNYRMELLEAGYLNKPISQEKLVCLARLIGAINTDGHLGSSKSEENDNNYYRSEFNVGEEADVFTLTDDITKIGFGNPSVERYISKFVDKVTGRETIYKTWRVIKNGAFAYLLNLVGGFVGKKTNMSRQIPDWIMNGNKLIKREFLSAFQGGDGSKVSYQSNETVNTFKIAIGRTSQTTSKEYEQETIKYMNQISTLFSEFDIGTHVAVKDSKDDSKKVIEIVFQQNAENILKYVNIIGYRYCEEKRRKSASVIEHLKIRECIQNDRKSKYDIMYKLLKDDNNSDRFIAEKCDLSVNQVNRIKNKLKKGIAPEPRFTCSDLYDDFIRDNIMENGKISVCIKEIKEIPNEMIYDFTTMSYNHNFVGSSFVFHNCPTETPEGSKIGIVKSLAMMSGVAVQNSTQMDVIKTILKQNKNIKHPYDVDPLSMNRWVKILINGDWMGVCNLSESQSIYDMLKRKRRENMIDKYTSIVFDYRNKEIRIYFDGGRLIRPILIVTDNKLNLNKQVIDDIAAEYNSNDKSKSWKKILTKYPNLIEYEDIESLNYMMVAENEMKLEESNEAMKRKVEYTDTTKINRYGDYRFIRYTHCDFHSWVMLGAIVGNIPFCDHSYSTRNIIHFSQAKQSIGIYMTSYKDRMDISQILYHPQVPLVTTQAMKYNNCMDLPYGENAIVAVCSYTGLTRC